MKLFWFCFIFLNSNYILAASVSKKASGITSVSETAVKVESGDRFERNLKLNLKVLEVYYRKTQKIFGTIDKKSASPEEARKAFSEAEKLIIRSRKTLEFAKGNYKRISNVATRRTYDEDMKQAEIKYNQMFIKLQKIKKKFDTKKPQGPTKSSQDDSKGSPTSGPVTTNQSATKASSSKRKSTPESEDKTLSQRIVKLNLKVLDIYFKEARRDILRIVENGISPEESKRALSSAEKMFKRIERTIELSKRNNQRISDDSVRSSFDNAIKQAENRYTSLSKSLTNAREQLKSASGDTLGRTNDTQSRVQRVSVSPQTSSSKLGSSVKDKIRPIKLVSSEKSKSRHRKRPRLIKINTPRDDHGDLTAATVTTNKILEDVTCKSRSDMQLITASKPNPFKTICSPFTDSCYDYGEKDRDKIIPSVSLIDKFERLGGDPTALTQALCFLNKHKDTRFRAKGARGYPNGMGITNQRYITINDLTKRSSELRLFVIDLKEGTVKAYKSGHGKGSKRKRNKRHFLDYSSNEDNSLNTPRGFFLTGNTYRRKPKNPKDWSIGMRLHGIQEGVNDNSFKRGIVMHAAYFVPKHTLSAEKLGDQKLSDLSNSEKEKLIGRGYNSSSGLSWGCTSLGGQENFDEIVEKIGSGVEEKLTGTYLDKFGNKIETYPDNQSLYYNYTSVEQAKADSYCGEERGEKLMLFREKL